MHGLHRSALACFLLTGACGTDDALGGAAWDEADGGTDGPADPDTDDPDPTEGDTDAADLDVCPAPGSVFVSAPIDPEHLHSIIPMGTVAPPDDTFPVPHTSMVLADPTTARPVRAPADATVVSVISRTRAPAGERDVAVYFAACDDVAFFVHHLTSLTPSLQALVDGDEAQCFTMASGDASRTDCRWDGQRPFVAGEVIGDAGGPNVTGSGSIDFGLVDRRAEPSMVMGPEPIVADLAHAACPFENFSSGAMASQYDAKLAMVRPAEPRCGSIATGQPSTAAGRWYAAAHGAILAEQRNHLALVPSMLNPAMGVLSIGNRPVGTGAYYFPFARNGTSRPLFTEVGPGGAYCYDELVDAPVDGEPIPGHVVISMRTASELTVQRVATGPCPTDLEAFGFGPSAVTFVRP